MVVTTQSIRSLLVLRPPNFTGEPVVEPQRYKLTCVKGIAPISHTDPASDQVWLDMIASPASSVEVHRNSLVPQSSPRLWGDAGMASGRSGTQ